MVVVVKAHPRQLAAYLDPNCWPHAEMLQGGGEEEKHMAD